MIRYNVRVMGRFLLTLVVLGSVLCAQKAAAPLPAPPKTEGKGQYTVSGTQYWDLVVGSGKKAIPGFTLRVMYTGWYKKGKDTYVIFDHNRGKDPFEFDLGMRRVIKGWDEAITGMRVGGKRLIVVPPDAGYGAQGAGKIPGNTTLIFEVELVDVR